MIALLRDCLAEPRLKRVNFDSDDLIRLHRQILMEKPMIRGVFEEIYRTCLDSDRRWFSGSGMRIEIGAGSSFFKEIDPELISTDIKHGSHLDRVLDAQAMDLPNGSVRAIYGIHCFHHLPEPRRFFAELERVLSPGGGCVLIEPYHGPVATWFFRRMFKTETFDKSQQAWETQSTGVMVGANQALSYLVFARDRARFEQLHPNLEIVHTDALNNYLRYLCSGGLNFRAMLPSFCTGPLKALEWLLSPMRRFAALHHVIVLRKRS